MKLTIRRSDALSDWYVIERAEHDGRAWFEPLGHHSMALRCSSRFSDADVEGTAEEMRAIADAIEKRATVSFRRCAVSVQGESVLFWSPRNSMKDGIVLYTEAAELAALIRKELDAAPTPGEAA